MKKKKLSKLLARYLPYVVIVWWLPIWAKHGGWPWAKKWAIKSCR